jgi:hypothetical protein
MPGISSKSGGAPSNAGGALSEYDHFYARQQAN